MATAHHHHRTLSHPKTKSSAHSHPRPHRPAPLSKRASYQKNAKEAQAQKKHDDDDDEVMAASFLNFCATCEKQIIVPSNSVLYCSESCRRKDTSKSLSHDPSPPQTPFSHFSFDDPPVSRDIVTPRSPTTLPSHRLSYGFSEPSEDESSDSAHHSEAARYLRSFPRATSPTNLTVDTSKPTHRPRYSRSSTSGINTSTAPSLSHTPTSTASMSMPYTPSARTPRHPSISCTAHRDLVTPYPGPTNANVNPSLPTSTGHWTLKSAPSCQISTGIADGELDGFSYEKTPIASPGQGSLKQLFAFSAMQAPPTAWP